MVKLNYKRKNNENEVNPLIVTFQKSIPNSELMEQLEFQLFQQAQPRKKKQQYLVSENHEKFDYIGKSNISQQPTKYLVGVMSEDNKGQMDIYDVDGCFNLVQSLKSDKNLEKIDSNIAKADKNIWDMKQSLVANMGTKKAQRKVQQMLNNMIDENKISSKAQMQELLKVKSASLQNKLENEMEEVKKQEENSKRQFLPEFDMLATEPSKIYDINSIISKEEFENIKCEPIMAALKKKQKNQGDDQLIQLTKPFNEFISKYKASTSYILKYLMYLDNLLKFAYKKQLTKASLEEVAQEVRVDAIFAKHILAKYYQATPQAENKMLYLRSPQLTDKLICHIIVLGLFAFGFKMDVSYLGLVLKLDQKKLISYSKEIGCTVNIKENKNKKAKTPNSINISLNVPFKLQPNKKPMKDKK
ncbi:hypothetical protein PPERSA_08892 [Pseudocohnilembus persalinus]|uniref:RNA polymerase I associated factor, A49-like protein n=1 Tax=Pseudocohnilembus persalinus TaxID=266149 RepID=A0A0V0QEB5_PSEPJ|nr:hypothetical protein PPERSA_08892 [Pseudocohnilembus persalinus]|eukprot:KRX00499.1 hypothetical protein PPERSA_08892 [Pseudocohnilembus persalinus]